MKKSVTLLLISILILGACVPKKGERTRTVEKQYKIEAYVDTFIKLHPNYKLNDVTKQETDEAFRKQILDSLRKENLLEDIPMQLEGINKNGENYVARFQSWIMPDGFMYKGITDAVHFDLLGTIDKSMISELKQEDYYKVFGTLIEYLDGTTAPIIYGQDFMPITNSISIDKDDIYDDKVEVYLGILYFQIDSIKPFKGRETIQEKY